MNIEYLSIKDAASYLELSTQTLRRWDAVGRLKPERNPANRYRRYRRSDLEKFRPEYKEATESIDRGFDYFMTTTSNISENEGLQVSQRDTYLQVRDHFDSSIEACVVQLSKNSGKSGIIATLPFGISRGRVLVIASNRIAESEIAEALDTADPKCFWKLTEVLGTTQDLPQVTVLDGENVSLYNCNRSHFVITNVQSLAASTDRWLPQFPKDYFNMIVIETGNERNLNRWQSVSDRFPNAKQIWLAEEADPNNDETLEKLLDQSSGVMGMSLRQLGLSKIQLKKALASQC